MVNMNAVIFVLLLAGIAYGLPLRSGKDYCEKVCSECGGSGLLKGDICECHVSSSANEAWECIAEAQKSFSHNYATRTPPLNTSKRVSRSAAKNQRGRRVPRQTFYDLGFNDFSSEIGGDAYSWERTYRSHIDHPDFITKTNIYEVYIGDDEEDSVQFIFPDSDGIQVEHQYFLEDENGREHPISRPLKEPEFPRKDANYNRLDEPGENVGWNDNDRYSKSNWRTEPKLNDDSWTYRGGKGETLPQKWENGGYIANQL